jgi:hypothetical protein
MGEDSKRRKKPLTDQIKERLQDLVDDLVGALEELVAPPPQPVPIRKR